jgi:hypothetical protein
MRTKTLLLTAALGAASLATSMAQVYSVNSVGYINLSLPAGYSLIANQLNTGNNGLNAVLPSVPVESLVLTFANNNYNTDIFDGTAWLDNATGNPTTTTVEPGKGFFVFNPTAGNVVATLVGEVPQGPSLSVSLPPGYKLISGIVPQELSLTTANGFPQVAEMQYQTYIRAGQPGGPGYDVLINDGTQWLDNDTGDPADARARVGEGFFIFNPSATTTYNWTRCFNVNTPCP